MRIPLQTKLNIFEAQNEYYSNQPHLSDASFVYAFVLFQEGRIWSRAIRRRLELESLP
jgi:hypothetical protein